MGRLEAEQEAFVLSIGDYTSGVFYDSFSTTPELLTKVAAKLRELEQAGDSLTFSPLTEPVTVTWRADFDDQLHRNHSSSQPALELHVVPVGAPARSARVMTDLADALPSRIRDSGLVDASEALTITRPGGAVVASIETRRASWNVPRDPQLLGIRIGADGQVSAWATLPGDGMGSILDPTELPEQIAGLLRLIGLLRVAETGQIAIGVGLYRD